MVVDSLFFDQFAFLFESLQFFPSSKRCSGCGYTMSKMALNVRSWVCPECGANHDRDVNAAKNIKAVGLTALACGESVNPKAA